MKHLTTKASAVTLLAAVIAAVLAGGAQAATDPTTPVDQARQQQSREASIAVPDMQAQGFQDDFITVAGPAAQAVQAEYGLPASVTAGQAIHESDWGRSGLSANDKNYFGFKCVNSSSPGPIAIGCHKYKTTECTPTCHIEDAYFRVYANMTDSFRDYGRLLTTYAPYAHALPYRDNPDEFIRRVGPTYATDKDYASRIIAFMQNWNLYRFNSGVPAAGGSSLSGDAKTDIATVLPNGDVKAWRNYHGFTSSPWDAEAVIATGFSPENAHFADLDGDGDKEIITVLANGDVKAWRNGRGFANSPWDGEAIIATGFTNQNIQFADLDGDRKAEIITVLPNGDVKAWHNYHGFTSSPWDNDAIIATGFTPEGLHFADFDGNGKADIVAVLPNGDVKAWRNYHGFANSPWDNDAIVATGFTNQSLHFADLDGDRKSEIVTVLPNGDVKAWHNYHGFANSPWDNEAIIATGFTNQNLLLI